MNTQEIITSVLKQVTELGSASISLILAVFISLLNKYLGLIIILSILCTTIISYIIKMFFFRERPIKQKKKTLLERIDASSFPSVHSARITAISFWIIIFFTKSYITLISVILVILVSYSRVYLKKHYWSDVFGGIIIAIIINALIYLAIINGINIWL